MDSLNKRIGSLFSGGVLEVDASNEKDPLRYISDIKKLIGEYGYRVTDVFKSQDGQIYHIHIKNRETN